MKGHSVEPYFQRHVYKDQAFLNKFRGSHKTVKQLQISLTKLLFAVTAEIWRLLNSNFDFSLTHFFISN